MALVQALLLGFGAVGAIVHAEEAGIDDPGAQVLTRGPVHEAFAGIVSYNPQPGPIVEKAPPDAIEELAPAERPAGDNITWIPGYWAWDDERTDYLWISGTWRALPPGREWTSGYWTRTGQGYQWISGYWADSAVRETTYLPKPPATVEEGPNIEAPSRDHAWIPGSWMWRQERYAWSPGYWALGRSDWDWIPAHYVWTPRGYVFVDGYWDYSFDRRGVLYAPVYFQSGYYSRPGFQYSPMIAIGLVALMEHLFLRPDYHHYYFGDYYDRRYRDSGYYWPYAYQSGRYGYDPVYSYRRWTHRQDRDWERRHQASYDYRRDHESARPPRTWAAQKQLSLDTMEAKEQRLLMATPFDQMARQEDSPVRIQQVPAKERQRISEIGRELRKTRDQRQSLEAGGVNSPTAKKTELEIKPTKARLPKSPIVGKGPAKFAPKQAPPKRPQAPDTAEPNPQKPDRQPDVEKSRPDVRRAREPRAPGAKKEQPKPERSQAIPRQEKEQPAPRREAVPQTRKQQLEPQKRADKPQREPRPKAREPERGTQQQFRQPPKTAPVKPADDAKPRGGSKQTQGARIPNSGGKPEPDKEISGQSTGKAQNKEGKH